MAEMAMVVIAELAVCTNCIHLLANGEVFESHAEITDAHADRIEKHYVRYRKGFGITGDVVPGGEELGISSRACELCGEESEGERFSAAELGPEGSVRAALPCGCVPHVTRMTEWGFRCDTEDQGYCNFECPHGDNDA